MTKLFKYELRRLLLNKFFLALLVITAVYSYQVLGGEIILGTAGTAPFSGWSYGTYLAKVLPLMLVTVLFFVTFLYSKKEKKVQQITDATALNPASYYLTRYAAIAVGFLIISLVMISISLVFYAQVFKFTSFSVFVSPILVTLLPSFFIVLGAGLLLGRVNVNLIYALMLLVFVSAQVYPPQAIDIFSKGYFLITPKLMPLIDGEPAFLIQPFIWAKSAIYIVLGVLMIVISLRYCVNRKKTVKNTN